MIMMIMRAVNVHPGECHGHRLTIIVSTAVSEVRGSRL